MDTPAPADPQDAVNRADPARLARLFALDSAEAGEGDGTPESDLARLYARLPPPERGGILLGDFLVGPPVGSGGFGTVHVGHQLSTGRKVAVKILRDGVAPDIGARFQREAAYLARFNHPHICGVLGYGQEPFAAAHPNAMADAPWFADFLRGTPEKTFFAMEWVEGRTLETVYREAKADPAKQPDPTTLVRWFADAAGALAAVHGAGLIHRDVKPGNLMVTADGALKLLDFGIARPQDPAHSIATAAGSLFGTLAYMSPEQLRAEGAQTLVGTATDLYSLCATFYELFTGRRLLDHDTQSAQTLCTLKLSGQRPAPPRALAPGLPWEIETLILGGLETDPADRPRTLSDLERDFRRFLADEPILYRRPTLARRAQLGYRRHRRAVQAATALALLALALFTYWWRLPGTLALTVTPAGARVTVDGRPLDATGQPQDLELSNGVHTLTVTAKDHAAETREVAIGRGARRDLALVLRRDAGSLEAEAGPAGAEMTLDGTLHGSRIVRRALDTGPHTLEATAPDHFEASHAFALARDEFRRERFTLEPGLLWRLRRPALQGALVATGDLDGDGVGELVHNETGRLVVFASSDGRELGERAMPVNTQRNFSSLELGGALGRVIVSGRDGGETPDLLFLTPSADLPTVAAFTHFAPSDRHGTFAVRAADDWDGDGVREAAVGARDGLHALDVAHGRELAHLPLPAGLGTPTVHACAGPLWLWSARREDALVIGLADLKTGALRWQAKAGAAAGVLAADLTGDGAADTLVSDDKGWRVLDGKDGAERGQGSWPFALGGPPALVLHPQGARLLAVPADAAQPLCALNPLDGQRLWTGPSAMQPAQPWAGTVRVAGLLPVATSRELRFLDPGTGQATATLPGTLEVLLESDGPLPFLALLQNNRLAALDARGAPLWTLRLAEFARPLAVLPNATGPARVALLAHRSHLAVAREPLLSWFDHASVPLQAGPQVAGRTVIQLGDGESHATLRAFAGDRGALAWDSQAQVAPNVPPTLADLLGTGQAQVVTVGRAANEQTDALLALSAQGGRLLAKWPLPESSWMACAPAVGDLNGDGHADAVVLRWDTQDAVALRGPKGDILWRRKLGTNLMGSPTFFTLRDTNRPAVLVADRHDALHALAGEDGRTLWKTPLGAPAESAPMVLDADGRQQVLQSDLAGGLTVVDAKDGTLLWRAPGRSRPFVRGHPAVCRLGDRVLILAPAGDAGLCAFDARTHTMVWRLPRPVGATPALADFDGDGTPEVVVADAAGRVWILDAADGQTRWQAPVAATVEADPAAADLDGDGKPEILVADLDRRLTVVEGKRVKLGEKGK